MQAVHSESELTGGVTSSRRLRLVMPIAHLVAVVCVIFITVNYTLPSLLAARCPVGGLPGII